MTDCPAESRNVVHRTCETRRWDDRVPAREILQLNTKHSSDFRIKSAHRVQTHIHIAASKENFRIKVVFREVRQSTSCQKVNHLPVSTSADSFLTGGRGRARKSWTAAQLQSKSPTSRGSRWMIRSRRLRTRPGEPEQGSETRTPSLLPSTHRDSEPGGRH